MTDDALAAIWDNPDSTPILNGAKGRKCRRHEFPESRFGGVPWPATCVNCLLTTEDPDAFFFPADFDDEMIPTNARCVLGARHNLGFRCLRCLAIRDPIASRRSRNNGKRGRRAELTIAREIPGARKMGPLGLPWDVEVGQYARLQVKKLVTRPSANAIRKLIEAIPNTGDRLRGFVWVEAAGRGKRGRREVWFLGLEFDRWHGTRGSDAITMMPLDEWVAEYIA